MAFPINISIQKGFLGLFQKVHLLKKRGSALHETLGNGRREHIKVCWNSDTPFVDYQDTLLDQRWEVSPIMAHQVVELNCPGCGARVNTGQKECEWCHKPIVISTFNSVYSMSLPEVNKYAGTYRRALSENPDNADLNKSIAMCYLKLKMVDKALQAFEKAIEENFDDSESSFYAAVCSLGGKKAFLNQRPSIDKALEYINAALMIEPRGIYYYFMAYIKYDYFERKHFKTSPNYQECLQMACDAGLSDYDIDQLYALLSVPRPDAM